MFNSEDLEPLNQQRAILENLIANTKENHIFKIMHAFQQGKTILAIKLALLEKYLEKLTKLSHLEQYLGYEIQRLQDNLATLNHLSFVDFTSDEQHFEIFALTAISLKEFWLLQLCVDNGVRLDDHELFIQHQNIALINNHFEHAAMFERLTTLSIRDSCILIVDKNPTPSSKLYFLKKLCRYNDADFILYDKLFDFLELAKDYGNDEIKRQIIKKRIALNSYPRLEPRVSAFQYLVEHNPKDLVVLRLIAEEYSKLDSHPTDENKDNIFHIILKHQQLDEDTVLDILKTIFSACSEKDMARALVDKDALGRNALCLLEEKPTYWEKVTELLHSKTIQNPIRAILGLCDVFSNMEEENTISRLYLSKKYKQLARAIRDREKLRTAIQKANNHSITLFDFIWSKNEYYMVSINTTSLFNHILKDEILELAEDPCFIQAAQLIPLGKTYIWQGYNLENIKQYVCKYHLELKFDDMVILDSASKKDDPEFSLLKYAISMSKYNKNQNGLKNIVYEEYGETLLFKAMMSQQPKKVVWLIKEIGCDPSFTYGNKENILIQILVRMNDKRIPNDIGAELIHACLDHIDENIRKKIINHRTKGTPTVLEWIKMCRHLKHNDNHKIKKDCVLDKLEKYLIAAGADTTPSNTNVAHVCDTHTRKTQTLIFQNPPTNTEPPEDILKKSGFSRLNPP